jgi:hypothetical protein
MESRTRSEVTTHDPTQVLTEARAQLAHLPRALITLTAGLDDAAWRARPAPERWAPVEIICHLRDEEQDDFGARVRAVLEGRREFAPIDPEGWVEQRRYRDQDPRRALAEFEVRRAASLELLARAAPERLRESGASGTVRLSGLDLLAAWVAHDYLHLRQLAGTLARLWATRWAPLRADYAGSLPYPCGEKSG